MKFYQYINEQSEEELERVKETLKKRCMPFLKEFDAPIYRGYNKGISGLMSRKVVRKDRKPRFVPQEVHEELDDLLESMYGWRPRSNGIFTGDRNTTASFGKTYMFFPVGKYQYIWTERTSELYSLYDRLTQYIKELKSAKDFKEKEGEDIESDIMSNYHEAKNQLLDLIKSGVYNKSRLNKMVENNKKYEAIFNCESYYLVNTGFEDAMVEWKWMNEL